MFIKVLSLTYEAPQVLFSIKYHLPEIDMFFHGMNHKLTPTNLAGQIVQKSVDVH